jgi:hypothetical protein
VESNDELKKAEGDLAKAKAELKHATDELVRAEHDLERAEKELKAAEDHCREIHFFLDGEPEKTTDHELTPNQIIEKFGHKSSATHYLVEIEHGGKKESFQGKGDLPIKLRDGMRFQMVSLGPTPVSDGRSPMGMEAFVQGLLAAGYNPVVLKNDPSHVVFDYAVLSGKHAGKQMRLGFIVPADFPLTTPTGPHVSPRIHPTKPENGPHPTHGVHDGRSLRFEQDAGGEWQYWSRPIQEWATSKKTVLSYLNHIWQLWDSQ